MMDRMVALQRQAPWWFISISKGAIEEKGLDEELQITFEVISYFKVSADYPGKIGVLRSNLWIVC